MGTGSSTEKKEVKAKTITNETGGLHFIELHLPSAGGIVGVIIVAIILGFTIRWWLKRRALKAAKKNSDLRKLEAIEDPPAADKTHVPHVGIQMPPIPPYMAPPPPNYGFLPAIQNIPRYIYNMGGGRQAAPQAEAYDNHRFAPVDDEIPMPQQPPPPQQQQQQRRARPANAHLHPVEAARIAQGLPQEDQL